MFETPASRNRVFLELRYLQRKAELQYGNEFFDSRAMKLFYIHNSNNDDFLDIHELRSVMSVLNVEENENVRSAISYISPGVPLRMSKTEFQLLMKVADCKPEL